VGLAGRSAGALAGAAAGAVGAVAGAVGAVAGAAGAAGAAVAAGLRGSGACLLFLASFLKAVRALEETVPTLLDRMGVGTATGERW